MTIKDEKSAAKFHYIKTASSKVVAQSIAFRVVAIYWQGDDLFPLKSWLKLTHPLLKAASIDTCSASTVRDRKRSSITLNKNSTRAIQQAINQGSTPLLTSLKWG